MRLGCFAGFASLLLSASFAAADPGDLSDRPGEIPRKADHVSVANRLAEAAMNAADIEPDAAGCARLDAAVTPSLAMLDAVIHSGDPYWQIIGESAKHDIFVGMIVRVRDSLGMADRAAHDDLEARIEPWRIAARDAAETVAQLAHGNPSVARRDLVIAGIATRSANARPPQVAWRR